MLKFTAERPQMSPAAKKKLIHTVQWSAIVAGLALLATLHWRSTIQAESRATERVRQESRDTTQDERIQDNGSEIVETRVEHKEGIKELKTELRAMDTRQQDRYEQILDRLPR